MIDYKEIQFEIDALGANVVIEDLKAMGIDLIQECVDCDEKYDCPGFGVKCPNFETILEETEK